MLILVQAFSFGMMWLLIFLIGRRKNWARYVYIIFFILGCPLSIKPLIESLNNELISGLLGIVQLIAQAAASVLLFKQSSREWFKNLQNNRS